MFLASILFIPQSETIQLVMDHQSDQEAESPPPQTVCEVCQVLLQFLKCYKCLQVSNITLVFRQSVVLGYCLGRIKQIAFENFSTASSLTSCNSILEPIGIIFSKRCDSQTSYSLLKNNFQGPPQNGVTRCQR